MGARGTEAPAAAIRASGIARALAMRPALLLADEPTGNLDSKSAQEMFALLRQLKTEHGTSVLLMTHNVALAERCDRAVEGVDGRPTGSQG